MVLATIAYGEIVDTSYWAAHTFSTGTNVKIINGNVAGKNVDADQFIRSAWTAVGHPDNYTASGVTRVMTVFP